MKLHDLKPTPRRQAASASASAAGSPPARARPPAAAPRAKAPAPARGGKLYRQGGNLPFFRRLPFKRGFTNIRRVEYNEVNLDQLAALRRRQPRSPRRRWPQAGLLRRRATRWSSWAAARSRSPLKVQVHRISQSAPEPRSRRPAAASRLLEA